MKKCCFCGSISKNGFTLIELLVVVLILGILAAIALPQYQKAVTKSRAANLQHLLAAVVDASNLYYLQHGVYPTSFEQLDVNLPFQTLPGSSSTCDKRNLYPSSVKGGDGFELTIYNSKSSNLSHNFISAHFTDGKYKCGGFVHYNFVKNGYGNNSSWMNNRTFCAEYYYNRNCNGVGCRNFCQQIMGKKHKAYIHLINVFE